MAWNKGPRYSPEEDELLRELFGKGMADAAIVDELARRGFDRSVFSVNARRFRLGCIDPTRPQAIARVTDEKMAARERLIANDRAFKAAMLAAIRSGEERAVLGVVKDRRPFALSTIAPEPRTSMCGSAAEMCVQSNASDRKPSGNWTPSY